MNAYICCLILLFVIYFSIKNINGIIGRKKFCLFAFFLLLFLHCFKNNEIYPDIPPYVEMFERLSTATSLKEALMGPALFEPIWTIITFLYTRLFPSSDWYLHSISFIICAGYSYFCYRYSKNLLFSFLMILLYPSIMNQSFYVLRQHLASVILLYSLPFIQNQNIKRFILCVLVASLIHYSAIIMLPLYYLYKLLERGYGMITLIAFLLVPLTFRLALSFLSYERFTDYANTADSNLLPLLYSGTLFIMMLMVDNKKVLKLRENRCDWFLYKSYVVYSFMVSLACVGSSLGRLSNYFVAFSVCVIPYFARYFAPFCRLVIYFVYLLFCIILIFLNINSGYTIFDYSLSFGS